MLARMLPGIASSSTERSPHAPYGDADWVARIRESDRPAFEALVRHYADRLCAFIYNAIHDAEATHELVQDVFLWIWRHRHTWEVRGSLTTYLYRSARNRAVSYARHARLERRWREEMGRGSMGALDVPSHVHTDDAVATAELSAAVERAIGALPTRCREVFTLNREHNLSYREIAETLEISVKTVEVHMGRALTVMRRHLSDWLTSE
jgi:RNA polymerase sigma-70 factor (ECF subfamily)